MKIINKLDFKPFDEYECWDFGQFQIKALEILLINNMQRSIIASIKWCYSSSTEIKKEFEFNQQGYYKAIAWLEDKRIEFAKQLL